MGKQGRVAENPLRNVSHADVRGKQQRRRAFTDEELDRLLAVAPPQVRLLYLAAAFTGLRVGELQQVVWSDIQLNHARPHIVVRASTTKNRKEAVLPLHPQLLKELQALKTPAMKPESRVFYQHSHPNTRIRIDMRKAGITRVDAMGRKLDFHALRYTFATKLAASGVSQRLAQELLRHSDPRLTANIYTDVTQLPTFAAVNGLRWQAEAEQPAQTEGIAGKSVVESYTAIAPQTVVSEGQNTASADAVQHSSKLPANPHPSAFQHVITRFVKGRKMERATGLESESPQSESQPNEWDSDEIPAPITVVDPHETEKVVDLANDCPNLL